MNWAARPLAVAVHGANLIDNPNQDKLFSLSWFFFVLGNIECKGKGGGM